MHIYYLARKNEKNINNKVSRHLFRPPATECDWLHGANWWIVLVSDCETNLKFCQNDKLQKHDFIICIAQCCCYFLCFLSKSCQLLVNTMITHFNFKWLFYEYINEYKTTKTNSDNPKCFPHLWLIFDFFAVLFLQIFLFFGGYAVSRWCWCIRHPNTRIVANITTGKPEEERTTKILPYE